MKAIIALFANNSAACFDRMYPALSNAIGQKFGLATTIIHTRSKTIGTLKQALRTELGTSDATYANLPDEPHMEGECQGKGNVPTL